MVFGESELAFTDTSEAQDESQATAFPIFGFGGGVRGTIHATERVAFFLQGASARSRPWCRTGRSPSWATRTPRALHLAIGGRLGVEWYQVDRHLALAAQGGVARRAGLQAVASVGPRRDTPLMWDAALGLRYTF